MHSRNACFVSLVRMLSKITEVFAILLMLDEERGPPLNLISRLLIDIITAYRHVVVIVLVYSLLKCYLQVLSYVDAFDKRTSGTVCCLRNS